MSLDFSREIQMVRSEFGVNNMKTSRLVQTGGVIV